MKRYETYKDSGIQWVGEIPSHWDIVKTSYLFDDIGSGTTPNTNDDSLYDTDNGINWLQTGDLNDGHITKTSKKISQKAIEENSTLRLYPINSLVIALYGATIGKVGVLDIETTTNQACCVLPPSDKVSTDFAYYIFIASKEALLNLASGGGQPNISQAIIKNHRIPYPLYAEQQVIAAYLDHKVGQIDATIAEKEQMLEDLKNYRSTIISEAVTKGLDKTVEMKNSGVDWIGMMPKHWVTKRLKFVSDNFDGTHYSPETKENGKPYVTAADIRGKGIDYASTKKISQKDYNRLVEQGCKIENNDVLLVKDGATTGRIGLMIDSEECVALSSVAMLRPKEGIYPLFLMYCMMSNAMQTQITNSMAGSAMPRITLTKLNEFVVCVPHLDEQRKIAVFVDGKVEKINRTIDEINIQIDALKSYKSALIMEAVTGKIDLREWEPKEENV